MFYGWWLVLVGLITQGVVNGTVNYAYSVIVLPVGQEFHASRMAMMWAITCCMLVSSLASPWLGSVADRRSMRALMAAGGVWLAIGFCVLSVTSAVWQVVLCYALFMSLGLSLLGPLTASTLIARWFSGRRGLALGLLALGPSFGGLVFPPLLQHLISTFEWRVACRLLALVILVLTLPPTWLLVVNRPADKGLHPDGGPGEPQESGAPGPVAPALTTAAVLRRRDFWLIAFAVGVLIAVYSALTNNLAPYAVGEGLTRGEAAALLSVVAVTAMVGKLLFGLVADRVDLRWAMEGGIVLVCAALLMFRTGHSAWLVRVGCVTLGLAAGGILPVWGAMLGKVFGVANYGHVMGLMTMVYMPLLLVSSPLAGRLFDITGTYRLVFEIFIAVLVLAAVLVTRIQPLRYQAS
jgi:MFS family permease